MLDRKKVQYVVMILAFIYAGISALLFFYQLYFLIRLGAAPPIPPQFNNSVNESFVRRASVFRGFSRDAPIILITSFLGMIISSLAGYMIMDLMKKKEKREIKTQAVKAMLMPEEKLLIKLLEDNNGELTQSELVNLSKLTKLKVSRVIKRLESLKVVSKYSYGVTNKIILEQKTFEE